MTGTGRRGWRGQDMREGIGRKVGRSGGDRHDMFDEDSTRLENRQHVRRK